MRASFIAVLWHLTVLVMRRAYSVQISAFTLRHRTCSLSAVSSPERGRDAGRSPGRKSIFGTLKLEIRFVERGIYPIAKSTMS